MQEVCYGIDGTTYLNSYWFMEKTFPCIVGIVKHFSSDLQVSQEIHQFEAKAMLQGEQEVRQQELAEVVGILRCQGTTIVVNLCETHWNPQS